MHEFLAGVLVFEERAGELRRGGHGILLLDASHGHAKVLRLDDDGHSEWIQHFLQAVFDLGGEPFLKLQPTGIALHHARDLAQSHDGAVRDVADVRLPEERQQMVLAQRIDFDVLHHDNLLVILVEQGAFKNRFGVLAVAVCQKVHGFGHAHRGFQQTFPFRVFAQALQYLFVMEC